ncbi:uncharacterized protein KGF55_003526 [Candida pseudojiufengensis]|uniref:uncharacterized protein n=1 Tax=Candida pseudojiufengensis TaxID=497109 RepID=UPI0022255874|nr:uncharacterized protein KGF55_003526 [Candida pseudojiufengensis]KAI5962450.1 hypothetical protein KGF55_003526 [Candida pseudojiufengensis]
MSSYLTLLLRSYCFLGEEIPTIKSPESRNTTSRHHSLGVNKDAEFDIVVQSNEMLLKRNCRCNCHRIQYSTKSANDITRTYDSTNNVNTPENSKNNICTYEATTTAGLMEIQITI